MRILAGTVLLALAVGSPATAQRSVDQRRPAARDAAVSIYMLRGSVRVVGWAVDSVVVTGAVAEGPGQLFLGGSRRGLKLGVWAPGKELEPQAADLEVRVPAGSRVWVKAADAGIEVTGVHGGLDLYSVSGPIRVAGSPRDVRAESMAGDVEIAASTPSLRAKSASGTVLLRGSAEDATVSTVSGSVLVQGGKFQRGRFESVTGDIRFQGDIDRAGSLGFQSHSGTIELRLPATVAADFLVSTFQGELDTDFWSGKMSSARELRGRELAFTTGRGGAQVAVRSFSGRIVLRKLKK